MIPWLEPGDPFPPVGRALRKPNGLLAASEDLTAERLVDAYSHGIFPWYSEGQPVLWWSPDPRMVLEVANMHVRRSLAKAVRNAGFEVRVDTAFRDVMQRCAGVPRPGQDGTWITAAVVDAYSELHRRGHAHSVESWREGRLVGGLYGVSIGRMFFGESMFAIERDASKVAFVHLVAMVRARDIPLIDCQQETPHLASFGARPISREQFGIRCRELVAQGCGTGPWAVVDPRGLL